MFETKNAEKIKTHFMSNKFYYFFFSKIVPLIR